MSKEANKTQRALSLALEELRYVLDCINEDKIPFDGDDFHETIKALEEALAKQEQGSTACDKPVAWGMEGKDGFIFDVICPAEHEREEGGYTTPLYTTPQQAQRAQLPESPM